VPISAGCVIFRAVHDVKGDYISRAAYASTRIPFYATLCRILSCNSETNAADRVPVIFMKIRQLAVSIRLTPFQMQS
jgi:hypothetical protein